MELSLLSLRRLDACQPRRIVCANVAREDAHMVEVLELVLVVGLGGACLVGVGAVSVLRKGLTRAPLSAFALMLAQLPLLLSAWMASRVTSEAFAAAAAVGFGIASLGVLVLRCVWLLIAGSSLSLLAVGLFSLGLLPLPFARAESESLRRPASARRTAFLLALAAVGVIAAGALFEYTRQTVDIVKIVVMSDGRTAEGKAAAQRYEVLTIKGSQGIAAASSRIARGTVLGSAGAPFLIVVVFGAALVGAIVAWPARASRGGAALWLVVCLLFCAVSLFWVARLGMEARALLAHPPSASAPA
jgi:hypothetical protein